MKTPTINVNLKPCRPLCPFGWGGRTTHAEDCPGAPVVIPCPIPRSVTFEVRLGECTCASDPDDTTHAMPPAVHLSSCRSRPVRVSCSISGKTWEESKVGDIDPTGRYEIDLPTARDDLDTRWALVKERLIAPHDGARKCDCDRCLLFSALSDMAQAESVILQRFADIDRVYTNRRRDAFKGHAASELAAYVERMIEQVGVLS